MEKRVQEATNWEGLILKEEISARVAFQWKMMIFLSFQWKMMKSFSPRKFKWVGAHDAAVLHREATWADEGHHTVLTPGTMGTMTRTYNSVCVLNPLGKPGQ